MDQITESEINISGLTYISDFISVQEQYFLLGQIDQQPWLMDLKRRVQHYGYKYDYKARTVSNDAYLGLLPDWLSSISQKLHNDNTFPSVPDQAIVNEYLPGQGISAHIDCVPALLTQSLHLASARPASWSFSLPGPARKNPSSSKTAA